LGGLAAAIASTAPNAKSFNDDRILPPSRPRRLCCVSGRLRLRPRGRKATEMPAAHSHVIRIARALPVEVDPGSERPINRALAMNQPPRWLPSSGNFRELPTVLTVG